MSKRNYERLVITTFGRQLVESGDLDPIYIALKNMEFDDADQLDRWLLAYWCLYHAGAASYVSEGEGVEFWHRLYKAAENTEAAPTGGRWPRGHERRHFRGAAATKAVDQLRALQPHSPEVIVQELAAHVGDVVPFSVIAERSQRLPLFGPWISFKIGDMLERVLDIPISFNNAAVFMFKDPREAAFKLWRQTYGFPDTAKPKAETLVIEGVVTELQAQFSELRAPPHGDRPLGLQEIETILCKWKSHMNGHYPLYNDIDEITEGLSAWRKVSTTADMFHHAMPKRPSS